MPAKPPRKLPVIDPVTGAPIGGLNEALLHQLASNGIFTRDFDLPNAELAGAVGPGVLPHAHRSHNPMERPLPTHRPLAGASSNNRGMQLPLLIGGPAGLPEQNLNAIMETPRTESEDAESLVVTLGYTIQGDESVNQVPVNATAVIAWGVGGATYEAEIDWGMGTTFVIQASYLKISVFVQKAITASPATVFFAASVSYGNPNSSRLASPARRTLLIPSLAASGGTSALTQIPNFANSFNIVQNRIAPSLEIDLFDASPVIVQKGFFEYLTPTNNANCHEQQFPIPNGGRFFQIINNAALAAGSGPISVIFNLAI